MTRKTGFKHLICYRCEARPGTAGLGQARQGQAWQG